jgi:hypothetical protein
MPTDIPAGRGELLRSRIVVGVCLSLCAHAASQSFCDMVLGRHVLLLSQDKESGNVGAMFSVMPAVYRYFFRV